MTASAENGQFPDVQREAWHEVAARLAALERAVTPEKVDEIDEERVRVAARRHGFVGGDSQALADWIERRLELARRVDMGEMEATVRIMNGELALAQVRLQDAMRKAIKALFVLRDGPTGPVMDADRKFKLEQIALDLQKAIMEQHT